MRETELEEKRREREEQEKRFFEEKREEEIMAKSVDQIMSSDIQYIHDVPRLLEIIRQSDDKKVVTEALYQVYYYETPQDINLIRGCLPGKWTYLILNFLAIETKKSVYSYIIDEKLVRKVVPALQTMDWQDAEEYKDIMVRLLEKLHMRKFDRRCNFEEGVEYSCRYSEIMRQIGNPDPWEAFKNIDPAYYYRKRKIDDSDEMSYLSSQDDDMDDYSGYITCGYSLQDWRWKLLSEANLIIDGVD